MWWDGGGSQYHGGNHFAIYKYISQYTLHLEVTRSSISQEDVWELSATQVELTENKFENKFKPKS